VLFFAGLKSAWLWRSQLKESTTPFPPPYPPLHHPLPSISSDSTLRDQEPQPTMAGATVGPLRSTWAWGFDWCQKPNALTRSGLLVRVWSAIPPPSFHSTPPPHPYRKEDTSFQATHKGFKQFSQLDFSCWWTLHLESATPCPPFLLTCTA